MRPDASGVGIVNSSKIQRILANSFTFLTSDVRTKFGFDTGENEPFQVCPLSAYGSPRYRTLCYVPDLRPIAPQTGQRLWEKVSTAFH